MADYDYRYSLRGRPEGTNDGSGKVSHVLSAVYRLQGATDPPWESAPQVPGHGNKSVPVPATELEIVLDMPNATGAERQAKNQAYKDLLAANIGAGREPSPRNWSLVGLEAFMDVNDFTVEQADRADVYITQTLNQEYPVAFSL